MARPFADVLRDLSAGKTYDDLTAGLAELVDAVMTTRKAGELSLKLSVRPNGENSVRVCDDIKVKVPQPARGETLFFTTSSGSLLRNDPRQPDLPLRDVSAPASPLKEVAHG